jgi:hypothetical protein
VDLPSDEMPPQSTVQGILWELYELNFHFELIALDRRMSNGAHDNLIAACFPNSDGGMTFVALLLSTRGLATDDWHACLPYVKAFINIMYTWNVRHPQAFRYVEQLMTKDQFLELEKAAVCFYTQSFFDVFGRAPIVPHHVVE